MPQAGCPGWYPSRFWTSPWRRPQSHLIPLPALQHCPAQQCCLMGRGSSWAAVCAPEPLCLALSTTEQSLVLSSYTSLQGFMDMGEIPQGSLCFRVSSPSSLSLSSTVELLQHLGGPLLDSFQFIQVSLNKVMWQIGSKMVSLICEKPSLKKRREVGGKREKKYHVMYALWHYPEGFYLIFFWYVTDVP